MKRMTLFVMALAMVLGLAQCKKDQPTPETQGVTITLDLEDNNDNGAKVNVDPNATNQVTFEDGDQILVASGGKYIGTLTRENNVFSGSIVNPVEGERLYFYFLGNKVNVDNLEAGTTEECSVNISDQSEKLPVISMGKSTKNYSANLTSYSSRLFNKCSLMKFNVTTPSEAAICLTGMNNVVNVNFGQPTEDNYGFTYGMDAEDGGLIKMHAKDADNETWAIVLPQAALAEGEEGSVYSDEGVYVGSRPAIHAIEVNKFYHEGDDVANVTLTNYTIKATPLTIEAKEAGATVRLSLPSQAGATMEYSTDGTNWSSYNSNTPITLTNAGDKVMFRAPVSGNTRLGYLLDIGYGNYVVNGSRISISEHDCYVYGNVMSLLYQDFFDKTSFPEGSQYTMPSLFTGCDKLYNHPDKAILLPATTLAVSCYESMFNNCEKLTTIPELPATTLAKSCYNSMFNNCTSLTSIPSDLLPVTNLAESCYKSMFNHCSSLTTIPSDLLPATTLKNNCYQNMFTSCTGLTAIPENLLQSVTTLANYCYASMFSSCSGLTSVPDDLLSVTTLAPYCYQYMFSNCTGLTTVPADLLPATTLATNCYEEMFYGCTSLTTAPDLPAATMVNRCYYRMFNSCSNLHSIKCLATSGINTNNSTSSWVNGVASTGTFYADLDATWSTGQNGIPNGWLTIRSGALPGKFTINANGDQVYFSQGNLQYIGSAGNGVASEGNPGAYWKFAEHQWETLGNNGQTSTAVAQDRDLFAWGSSGYNHNNAAYQPWHHRPSEYGAFYAYGSWSNALYSSTGKADWGYNAIQNGGNTENSGWRTMKNSEYAYILSTRTTSSGIRYAKASIDGYNGVILLPDDWDAGYYTLNNYNTENANFNTNSISMSDWISQLESHGAVFLPVAGQRHAANTNSITIQNYNSQGRYWLSETNGSSYKYQCRNHLISAQYCRLNGEDRREGLAVRLVRNVE